MTQETTTAHHDWPVQLVLPGQAAAPEGPVDMVNMYLFHFAFRRDLRRFATTVPATAVGNTARWRLLAARWAVFADQLHHHHAAEDAVLWPWLRSRVGAEDLAVLEAMAAEHDTLDPALARVAPAFAALSAGPDAAAHAVLVTAVAEVRACLEQHLAHEEADAIAVMQRVMTDGEWKELEKRLSAGQSPTAILTLVPWAVEGLDVAERREVFARAPLAIRVLARVLSPRFARRDRRAFGGEPVAVADL